MKGTYTIRQKGNRRFVDAHETADRDFALVELGNGGRTEDPGRHGVRER